MKERAPSEPAPQATSPLDNMQGNAQNYERSSLHGIVDEAEAQLERRVGWATWAVGLGLALLALSVPTERLLGRGPDMVLSLADQGPSLAGFLQHGLSSWLSWGLASASSMSLERAAFLVSALAMGLCFTLLVRTARSLGADWTVAWLAGILSLGTAAGVLSATTPGPAGLTYLGVSGFVAILFRPQLPGSSNGERLSRAALATGLATLANPILALLTPAAMLWFLLANSSKLGPSGHQDQSKSTSKASSWRTSRMTWTLGVLALVLASFVAGAASVWIFVLPGALMALALLAAPPDVTQTRPPIWLTGLLLLAPVALFPERALECSACLAPLAALGTLYAADHWQSRNAHIIGTTRRGRLISGGLLLGTLACTVGALLWVRADDPNRAWVQQIRQLLNPDDCVASEHSEHAYLLQQRFGLPKTIETDSSSPTGRQLFDGTLVPEKWRQLGYEALFSAENHAAPRSPAESGEID